MVDAGGLSRGGNRRGRGTVVAEAGVQEVIVKVLFPILLAVLAGCLSGSSIASGSEAATAADAPRIIQVLGLPDGRMAVLTAEKGGLYVSAPGGRGWRRWAEIPEVFIHQMTLNSSGTRCESADFRSEPLPHVLLVYSQTHVAGKSLQTYRQSHAVRVPIPGGQEETGVIVAEQIREANRVR